MAIHTAYSSFKFSTDALEMQLRANPTSTPTPKSVRISINGIITLLEYDIEEYKTVNLGSGTKIVEITEDRLTLGTPVLGIFITSIRIKYGSNYTIISTDNPENRLVFLGDSITGGTRADLYEGFTMLFRYAGNRVSVYEYGGWALHDMADTAGQVADLVTKLDSLLDGTVSNKLTILLGTNDWAGSTYNQADFTTKYSDMLVAINAARADVSIFCITPTVRTNESANAQGCTLGDYRTAVANAVSGKGYCTLIDGTTLFTTDYLDDTVHPTTAGHLLMYDNLKEIIL